MRVDTCSSALLCAGWHNTQAVSRSATRIAAAAAKHCWLIHSFGRIRRTPTVSSGQRVTVHTSHDLVLGSARLSDHQLLNVQVNRFVCSSSPAILDRELPQSKQPGLVLTPGPAGSWDHSAVGNPVVSPLTLLLRTPLSICMFACRHARHAFQACRIRFLVLHHAFDVCSLPDLMRNNASRGVQLHVLHRRGCVLAFLQYLGLVQQHFF